MTRSNKKKTEQLGMPYGTACGRLRKLVLFSLIQRLEEDRCYRCGETITTVEELSIEHPTPWLDSDDPAKLFFDLDNIAFSHLKCNSAASRQPGQKYFSDEERQDANRDIWRRYKRRNYSPEARRNKYIMTGH